VLNPWNLDALEELEAETGRRVFNILQLRVHPSIVALRERIARDPPAKPLEIDLTYITSRGNWYFTSWKGDQDKSGGIASNIGIHFFDMLTWVFGPVQEAELHLTDPKRAAGMLRLERAVVRWFLSVEKRDLPDAARALNKTTFRSLTLGGAEVEFSDGFAELHTSVYRAILAGGGFGIEDARTSINLVHRLRTAPVTLSSPGLTHPYVANYR
jgi:UDP-N-acetyl-2-amino-2-deoxyglucuronate dehydrogenase